MLGYGLSVIRYRFYFYLSPTKLEDVETRRCYLATDTHRKTHTFVGPKARYYLLSVYVCVGLWLILGAANQTTPFSAISVAQRETEHQF